MQESKKDNGKKESADAKREAKLKERNIHKGHRQSVRERYYVDGMNGMPDHNILEFLLFFAIPYKDTNEIAHLLIDRFGSFSGVLQASLEELKGVKGMTENAACLITMLLPIYRHYFDDQTSKSPSYATAKDLADYIRPKFIDSVNERAFLICFDNSHHLITSRQICEGSLSSAVFKNRDIAQAVLETKASEVILVHNHPVGIALPSENDVKATIQVYDFLKYLDVKLTDHIIITREGHCSMACLKKFAPIFKGLPCL